MKKIVLIIVILLIAVPLYACEGDGLFPDIECTPGDVFPECSVEQMCVRGYSATVRSVSKSLKNEVYELYGIPKEEQKNYVIDHLISLQICGTNEIANLFPQRREGVINSRTKDKIENFLKREVCKGNMLLEDAQVVIAEDWLSVWEHYTERND